MQTIIKGFSKLSREEKVQTLIDQQKLAPELQKIFTDYLHPSKQFLFENISENIISNYYLPFSLAPNFLINDKLYILPMVIEESSVVAAASKAARFWASNGGFKTRVINSIKNGQIFFNWQGDISILKKYKAQLLDLFIDLTKPITQNMRKRGGGIIDFEFKNINNMSHTYQALIKFKTADSMGANFINSCLETIAPYLADFINQTEELKLDEEAYIVMSILSNYTPECIVECKVSCPIENLIPYAGNLTTQIFAKRFKTAVDIATNDPFRAVTHNKGIFNGIDALLLATGNDFRAIEASAHAYSFNEDNYTSLTKIHLTNTHFEYTLQIPLALGTVGGLTQTHPLAKAAIEILGKPSANELMQITASAGLANNFAAIASLVTTGIQKGHMKLHLSNILQSFNATVEEKEAATKHFKGRVVSFSLVNAFIKELRK